MMFSFFSNFLNNIVCWIKTGVMEFLNLVIVGLADGASAIFGLLPAMPAALVLPTDVSNALAHADYYVPLTFIVSLIASSFVLILAIWLVKIPLRAIKATQ
jgi:hypothetical protein